MDYPRQPHLSQPADSEGIDRARILPALVQNLGRDVGRRRSALLTVCLLTAVTAGCSGNVVPDSAQTPAPAASSRHPTTLDPAASRGALVSPLPPLQRHRFGQRGRGRWPATAASHRPRPAQRGLLPAGRPDAGRPERVADRPGRASAAADQQSPRVRHRRVRRVPGGPDPGGRGSPGPVDPARPVLAAQPRGADPRQFARYPGQRDDRLRHAARPGRDRARRRVRHLGPPLLPGPGQCGAPADPGGDRPGVRAARPARRAGVRQPGGPACPGRDHLPARRQPEAAHRGPGHPVPAGLGGTRTRGGRGLPVPRGRAALPGRPS